MQQNTRTLTPVCGLRKGVRGGKFGSGPALQASRSRVLLPMVSLPYYGPGVDSASNRNEYQEYFLGSKGGRCEGLTNLPLSRTDCHEIWEPQPSWKPQGLSRPVQMFRYSLQTLKGKSESHNAVTPRKCGGFVQIIRNLHPNF